MAQTMSRMEYRIATTMDRMDGFPCECAAIEEPHRKRDCGPMWHALTWHKVDVHAVKTVEEANAAYKPCLCSRR